MAVFSEQFIVQPV